MQIYTYIEPWSLLYIYRGLQCVYCLLGSLASKWNQPFMLWICGTIYSVFGSFVSTFNQLSGSNDNFSIVFPKSSYKYSCIYRYSLLSQPYTCVILCSVIALAVEGRVKIRHVPWRGTSFPSVTNTLGFPDFTGRLPDGPRRTCSTEREWQMCLCFN